VPTMSAMRADIMTDAGDRAFVESVQLQRRGNKESVKQRAQSQAQSQEAGTMRKLESDAWSAWRPEQACWPR
jgi:hypothetical protein